MNGGVQLPLGRHRLLSRMTSPPVSYPATPTSDQDLIAEVGNGSDAAFEELYNRYSPRIRAYVLRMVGDHSRAEDLTQEVFIAALRRLRNSEGVITFKPWIYQIAKNACIDEFRRHRRCRVEVPLGDELEHASRQRPLAAVPAPTPEAAMDEKQQLSDLRSAFGVLSEHHHQVMVMRELAGLSYNQIGERLGMTRPAVESTLFRARRQLGTEYDELRSGRRCHSVQAALATGAGRPAQRLGTHQRRRLSRHLAHCHACRRVAREAGVDRSLLRRPSLPAKIAALLPLPWLRPQRSASPTTAAGARWPALTRSMQALSKVGHPGGVLDLGRETAAAAAALALAGAGFGLVEGAGGAKAIPHHRPGPTLAGVTAPSGRAGRASHRGTASAGASIRSGRARVAAPASQPPARTGVPARLPSASRVSRAAAGLPSSGTSVAGGAVAHLLGPGALSATGATSSLDRVQPGVASPRLPDLNLPPGTVAPKLSTGPVSGLTAPAASTVRPGAAAGLATGKGTTARSTSPVSGAAVAAVASRAAAPQTHI